VSVWTRRSYVFFEALRKELSINATEVGGWGFECLSQPGEIHVNEAFFLVELVDIESGDPIEELDMPGKIVITAFDRYAQP
jgi:phenylacetate-CoA ligase